MFESTILMTYLAAVIAIVLAPGPGQALVITRTIGSGRTMGLLTSLGLNVGTLVHTLAAALGLTAILLSSALAFTIVKYLGAAYLIYLGVRTLLDRSNSTHSTAPQPKKLSHIFMQGIIVNTLNPKTALFFFAFLPQFVDPARGSSAIESLLGGGVFVVMGICSDGVFALLAGTVRHWLRESIAVLGAKRYCSGSIYILLGISTAFSGAKES